LGIFLALLALSLMIFIHELGHFLAARSFGVTVERFSIGFGPILAKKWCCNTEWAISAIPLGGYVKMKGQDDSDPLAKSDDPDSYTAKKPWQRIIILLAGPFANFFLAYLLYFIVALSGFDTLAPKIGKVLPNSPAASAGLQKGDVIIAINNHPIHSWEELSKTISKTNGALHLKIKRRKRVFSLTLKPKVMKTKNIFGEEVKRPMIGIAPANELVKVNYSLFESFKVAWQKTIEAAKFIALGLEKMVEGVVSPKEIGGVITIMDVTAKASQAGFVVFLSFVALISVNLGILNLLPIPALDGGHIMFNLYEIVAKRPPSPEVFYRLTVAGWVFLIGLMGLGLFNDITRLLGGRSG